MCVCVGGNKLVVVVVVVVVLSMNFGRFGHQKIRLENHFIEIDDDDDD